MGQNVGQVKNSHVQKMSVAEMKMLRWMCGHTRRDNISNEDIWGKEGVASVVDDVGSEAEMIRGCEEEEYNASVRWC